ncbi:MAG: hypothetical protein ACLTYN_05935 [Dysosmobacter welbionis]
MSFTCWAASSGAPGGQLLLGWLLWSGPAAGELSLRLAPQQRSLLVGHGPSALTALLGWYRLSCTTCAYFLIGFLMGLVLGPTRRERPWDTGTTAGPSGDASICCPPHGAAGGTGGTEGRDVRFPPGTAAGGGTGPVPALSAVLAALAKAP